MWTLPVEVADVDAEDVLEPTATEDQKPVETLHGRSRQSLGDDRLRRGIDQALEQGAVA